MQRRGIFGLVIAGCVVAGTVTAQTLFQDSFWAADNYFRQTDFSYANIDARPVKWREFILIP